MKHQNIRDNEQGVAVVLEVLLAVVVLGAVGFAGYKVMKARQAKTPAPAAAATQPTIKTEATAAEIWTKGDYAVKGAYADADVVQIAAKQWRLYYASQPEGGKLEVYSATSPDGKTWTQEAGVRKTMATFPNVVKLADGSYRMYFQSAGVLKSAKSTDGLTFTDEAGTRIDKTNDDNLVFDNVAAPTVMKQTDGTYLMVYRGSIATPYKASTPVPNQSTQLLMWASSPDGLTWTKKGIAVDSRNDTLVGNLDGPSLVTWDDKSVRVFATSYTGVYSFTLKDGKFGTGTLVYAGETTKDNMGYHGAPPGDPTLAKIDGTWYMYYGGPHDQNGIWYATLK